MSYYSISNQYTFYSFSQYYFVFFSVKQQHTFSSMKNFNFQAESNIYFWRRMHSQGNTQISSFISLTHSLKHQLTNTTLTFCKSINSAARLLYYLSRRTAGLLRNFFLSFFTTFITQFRINFFLSNFWRGFNDI